MTVADHLRPIERRIYDLLADGQRHSRQEVLACLRDDQATFVGMHPHLSHLRAWLRLRGEGLICEYFQRNLYYRRVRLIGLDE